MKQILLTLLFLIPILSHAETKELKIFPTTNIWLAFLRDMIPKFEEQCKCKVKHIHPPDMILPSHRVMKDVHQGLAELGMASIQFEEWIKLTEEKEKIPKDKLSNLTYRVVGKDLIKVMTHPDVGVSALSDAAIADIFSGAVKNWADVGGKKVDIKPALISNTASRNRYIQTNIMGGKSYAPHLKMVDSYEALNTYVSSEPGAVTFIATNEIDAKKKLSFPKTKAFGRPNTLITVGKPSPLAQQFIDYIRTHQPDPGE